MGKINACLTSAIGETTTLATETDTFSATFA
jgi:hypothetical protein